MSIGGYTDNFSIPLSNFDTSSWIDEDWARWRLVDALISSGELTDVPIVVTTGAANAFVATYSPAIIALVPGLVLSFVANNSVTGAATLNVNGLGAKALKLNGADPEADDIEANSYVRVVYDGTQFHIIDPKKALLGNQNVIRSASGATPNAATDFYVESSGPTYVELLGPNASTQGYMFSRPSMTYAGGLKYDHINGLIVMRCEGNDLWSMDAAGFVTAAKFIGAFQGDITGNVTGKADAWTTARTLTLGTDASGNVSFDGSTNFTLNLTVVNDSISNAKLANMATQTIKGRTTAGTGDPEDLTGTQATALLVDVVGDSGSGGTKGLVPAATSGSTAKGHVLGAGGTFGSEIKGWGRFQGSTGAVLKARNLSCTKDADGEYTITINPASSSADYIVLVRIDQSGESMTSDLVRVSSASFTVKIRRTIAGPYIGPTYFEVLVLDTF